MIRSRFVRPFALPIVLALAVVPYAACDSGEASRSTRSDDQAKDAPAAEAKAEDAKADKVAAAEIPIFAEQESADRGRTQGRESEVSDEQAARFFTHYGVNPTVETRESPLSTFGIDVDTAAYATVRSHLQRQQLPPEASVRVEEVVNYFNYHYAPPEGGAFSLHAEVVPSPNRSGYHVLHLGLKGKEVTASARPDANLVFVIDVSGSMGSEGRLELVKRSLELLTAQLRPSDRVAVVVYGSSARVVLPSTPGNQRETIGAAIASLATEGSTNVEAGLRLGYELAAQQTAGAGINRVILCSDGVANAGSTTAEALLDDVADHAQRGINITTVGVGMGDYNDTLMEQLADRGDGNYAYVDDISEARKVFVDNLTSTLTVIAKDVKLQLEFDPAAVARYRLLGYENRGLAAEDFDDDRKDAGELGAGHTVTALYEIKLTPGEHDTLGTMRVRFKAPRAETSEEIERPLPSTLVRATWAQAAPPTRLSVVAAAYAEKLRGSYWVRNLTWEQIARLYNEIDPELRATAEVAELGTLIQIASGLDHRVDRFESDLPLAQMDFDRVPVLR